MIDEEEHLARPVASLAEQVRAIDDLADPRGDRRAGHLHIRNGDDGYEPGQPAATRLELIAQHTDVIDTAVRERLALIAEEIAEGGAWAAVFQAAGAEDDGMLQDELVEEVHDLLDQREER
ncbi:hypothetical protein [Actinomycetospora cinnamomea]|uniref:Uncharacterized protein n=1 Tax=Actinomycetospora cinnamomea TaxID=663609 RepID=A0A2U1F6N2_9PSEU|nr:hypothetical protein [Actinomycetospora cinnamomea]PVZ07857.1 hypothetical protein C8D89_11010 [Actinomycetospora cinnamomea]